MDQLSWNHLMRVGGLLVGIGLLVLIVFIPLLSWCTSDSQAKTEFYSARAAQWCVVVGLLVFAITVVGAIIQKLIVAAKGH